jgi:hypothetical protein
MGISTISIGKVKFNWRGNWAPATAYAKDDVVKYGPSVYTITEAHTSASTFAANVAKTDLMVEGIGWEDVWNSSTIYQTNEIVSYGGAIYIALQENTNQIPSSASAFWDRLVGGLEFEGNWSVGSSYQKGDIVRYGGYTYVASQDSLGIIPTNISYWDILNQGLVYFGIFDITVSYIPGQMVSYGGNLYACETTTSPGTLPTNTSFWFIVSQGTTYAGDYDILVGYKVSSVVKYGGNQYICVADTTAGTRPTNTSFWGLYLEGFNFRNDYAPSTSYNPGDVVKYGGRSYVCTVDALYVAPTQILPTNVTYWAILNKGLDWKGAWSASSVDYKLDDVVEYSGSSYVCVQAHTSSGAILPNTATGFWSALAVGDISSPMTTSGDMIYRNSVGGIVRLPIGPSGSFLVVNNGIPSWGVQAPEQNYYVSLTGDDNNDGRTVATAWRTLEHACNETYNLGQCKISMLSGAYTELCPIKVGRQVVIEGDGLGSVTISPENVADKGFGAGISKDGSTPNASSDVFHVNNASRIRNLVFRGFGSGAVCVSLDPGYGPNDTSVWIVSQSPYVQNCTSFTDLGTGMIIDGALHNGGYKSIVANDWTQINSDGIGFVVKNDGRSELVSCFTYYCNIGYLCESGGKIRSVGGNNSYGEYGAVARGFSQAETPLTGNLQLSDDTITSVQTFTSNVHIFTSYRDFSGNLFCVGHTAPTGTDVSSTWSNSASRPFIAKFTSAGTLDWSYTYESAFGALHCIVEIDNQYYAGGVIYTGGSNKGFLLKISSSGEIQWQKTAGDTDEIVDVTTDNTSFLYAVGNHTTNGVTVLRVQPSGIVSWSRTLDYNDSSINTLTASSICYAGTPTTSTDSYEAEGDATAEDDLYIACRDTTANVAMIVRMNNSGGLDNAYNYGDLFINKLRLDTGNGDGIYMMAVGYYDPVGAVTKNPFAMRVNILGDVEWQQNFSDSTANGEFKDVYPIGDDVYISGYINDTSNTYNKGIITRYTSNGTESWTVSVTNGTNNVAFNSVALDGVNVIAAGFNESSSVLVNIQRDLAGNLGVVTSENWILSTSGGSYSSSSIASKNIQNIYTQSPTIGLTDSSLTLNQSPGITRTTRATRTGFAGIGTGINFTISGLARAIKEGSVLQIDGNPNTYFVISVANFDIGTGTASIGIDPALPGNLTPDDDTSVVFREAFSQVRMTSHDFLDIGSGGFADTNYPVIIQADYVQQPSSDREVLEEGGGRVFYVTTDQDGNFRVGNYFKVEQSTGRATLSSEEFDLSGLNELQLGSITAGRSGATVNEFSTDGTFSDNSDTAVPTERATKTYVDNSITIALGGATTLKVGSAPNISQVEVVGTGSNTDTIDFDINGTEVAEISNSTFSYKPGGTLTFQAGTQYVKVPAGDTASRPATPDNGYLRYNTDNAAFEGYVNSQWSGIGGGNPWSTKSGAYTAVNNDRLFIDTSGGAVTITLPATPAVGDNVRFMDLAGTFDTNNLTVARNSSNIFGVADNLVVSNNDAAFQLIYTGTTYGWKLAEL